MAVAPNITYNITYRGTPVALSSNMRASFAEGWNTINVIFNSDISLCRYEARVTKADEEYGVGVGTLVYSLSGAIASSTNHSYNITVNAENFYRGDTTYRISMYAQNAIDLTWDATSFLLTSAGQPIVDKNGNPLEVYVGGQSTYSMVEKTGDDSLAVANFTSATQSGGTLGVN